LQHWVIKLKSSFIEIFNSIIFALKQKFSLLLLLIGKNITILVPGIYLAEFNNGKE